MCPLWPFHIALFYLLGAMPVWVLCQANFRTHFDPPSVECKMESANFTKMTIAGLESYEERDTLQIYSDSDVIATSDLKEYLLTANETSTGEFARSLNIMGNFLGKTRVRTRICRKSGICSNGNSSLEVIVTRKERIIDHIFTGSVATLVTLIYINFGCALDWPRVKETIRRPVGPTIGFFTQFLFMPLISYGFGKLLFPGNAEMQLGMFFTGVSPGGGASNIWTYVLNGNLNLSITMTTLSTFAAFGMMPFWLFTLGRTIFKSGNMGVPYSRIAGFAIGLIIPLGLGLVAQRYFPRFAKLMVRILKSFSAFLLLFIIVFAIVTNLYLFELFSWQIVIAGMCVPWLGYLCGYLSAYFLRQPLPDCLAIAIETGIQNTGIAIFLLRFSLPQPEADLTTVIPVSIAIMTPIPMILIYIYQVIHKRCLNAPNEQEENDVGVNPKKDLKSEINGSSDTPDTVKTQIIEEKL